jgi:hypothetical protein
VNEVPIPSREDGRQAFNEVLAHYDGPAYMRRARRVQASYEQLIYDWRRQRAEWLAMARIRLGTLRALAGTWDALTPHLTDDEQIRGLEELWAVLDPHLRVPIEPTTSIRALRSALRQLAESVASFNERWVPYIRALDLSALNGERADYNRYYLLEKECVVRSPYIARAGYKPLDPLTVDDVLVELPPLPVPRLRESSR